MLSILVRPKSGQSDPATTSARSSAGCQDVADTSDGTSSSRRQVQAWTASAAACLVRRSPYVTYLLASTAVGGAVEPATGPGAAFEPSASQHEISRTQSVE